MDAGRTGTSEPAAGETVRRKRRSGWDSGPGTAPGGTVDGVRSANIPPQSSSAPPSLMSLGSAVGPAAAPGQAISGIITGGSSFAVGGGLYVYHGILELLIL
jgi:hypothetical protein